MNRHTLRGLAATVSAGLVLAALPSWWTTPAGADDAAAPAADEDTPTVTVQPDPSYQGPAFEGWGTSLVWFANATGDYPAPIRDRLADLVFGPDGLNLNIARYNIGGGNAPDVPDYLRAGGAVEGWWRAPEGTTRDDAGLVGRRRPPGLEPRRRRGPSAGGSTGSSTASRTGRRSATPRPGSRP